MRKIVGTALACLVVASVLAPSSAQARYYYSPYGFFDVRGAIEAEWWRQGGPRGLIGNPLTNEIPTRPKVGAFNHFMGGASIYWSPATGAHDVRGAIRDRWASLGWENGHLGFPVTGEGVIGNPYDWKRYSHFQGGSIFYSPATGAWEVRGAIRERFASLGWEAGLLGFPVTNENGTPNGRGRYNHFQGGSVYWSPATGAQEVHGAIRATWASLGWEAGPLGFPVTSETRTPDGAGRFNHFQGGSIYWSPATGAHEVRGAIRAAWASLGSEDSLLGYPVSDEYAVPGGRRSDFEYGSLVWNPVDGVSIDAEVTGSGDARIPILPGLFAVGLEAVGSGATAVETAKAGWWGPNPITDGTGSWTRTALVNLGGQRATELVVTTDGDWTIDLLPVSALPMIGPDEVVSGSEGAVLHYTGPPGQLLFEATDANAHVRIFTRGGVYVDTLWAGVGSPAYWPVGEDVLLEVRQADVPWTVVVDPY
ncbi:MAG TPA: hypothetical protein VK402_17380 [Blastococcus sp.]|nr:hypothetical protein [Blastococcus sp.]